MNEQVFLSAEDISKLIESSEKKLNDRLNGVGKSFVEMKSKVDQVCDIVDDKRFNRIYHQRPNKSDTVGKIVLALSKAQKEMGITTGTGSTGRGNATSAAMPDLLETAVPVMERHELAYTFHVGCNEYGQGVITLFLGHSSGEWFETTDLLHEDRTMVNESEFQKRKGGAITYMMKNMFRAMLGMGKE